MVDNSDASNLQNQQSTPNAGLTITAVAAIDGQTHGTVVLVDGQITYTPNPNFSGVARFTTTTTDAAGLSTSSIVTINVGSDNDVPVFNAAQNAAVTGIAGTQANYTREDNAVTLQTSQLLAGVTDGDGDVLTITAIDNSPGAFGANSPLHGTAVLNPNGTITYTPAANFHGTAVLHYTVSDGQGGTVAASTTAVAGKALRERQQPIGQKQQEQPPAYMRNTYLIAKNNTNRSQLPI